MGAKETAKRLRKKDYKITPPPPFAPSAFALASFSVSWLFESARHAFPHSTPSTSPGHIVMSHNFDCCGNSKKQGS